VSINPLTTLAQTFQLHWHPELPPWVLVLGIVVAAVAIFYLYRAQLRIATKRAIVWLTIIRVLLVALVFVMLLGLELIFLHPSKEKGTLWLMLDQSQSMEHVDKKATPIEKLRWADALGKLPEGIRPSKLDQSAARLDLLDSDLRYFKRLTTPQGRVEESKQRDTVEKMVRGLTKWNELLTTAADAIEKDPTGGFAVEKAATASKTKPGDEARAAADKTVADAIKDKAELVRRLRTTGQTVTSAIGKIDSRQRPEDAASDLPWDELDRLLRVGKDVLNAKASEVDEKLVAQNDTRVTDAMNAVAGMTRAQLARDVLTRKAANGKGGLDELMPRERVKLLGFGDVPSPMLPDNPDDARKQIASAMSHQPSAPVTDMSAGLDAIIRELRSEPTALVIVSDGRQNRQENNTTDAVQRLLNENARVYGLGVGIDTLAMDAAVESVEAPEWVFKDDSVKITALLRLDNLPVYMTKIGNVERPMHRVTVDLYRKKIGETNWTKLSDIARTAEGSKYTQVVTALANTGPDAKNKSVLKAVTFIEDKEDLPPPGVYDYKVQIQDVKDDQGQVEEVVTNNQKETRVAVRDDKLTVLMFEDQPRWEFRYLANYLSREGRVRLQTKLQEPAEIGFDADPNKNVSKPPKRKPTIDEKDVRQDFQTLPGEDIPPPSPGSNADDSAGEHEWYQWQLIVIGDINPDSIPTWQQRRIVKAVKEGGSTVLFMGGPLNFPRAWADPEKYPLVELLPCEPAPLWTAALLERHMKGGYYPKIAPEGEKHLLSELDPTPEINASVWDDLTKEENAWYWHSTYTKAKASAKVIWSIADTQPLPPAATPAAAKNALPQTATEIARERTLLATMDYGLGKVLYISGDATWRLRNIAPKPEHAKTRDNINFHERFWGQVIRWALDSQLPAGGQFVRFGSDKVRYVGGENVEVTARVVDKNLKPLLGQKIKVQARALSADGKVDSSAPPQVEAEMTDVPGAPGRYKVKLPNLAAGQVELTLHGDKVDELLKDDPKALQKSLNVEVVKTDNLDLENVNADFPNLQSLSDQGGGVMLNASYANVLTEHLPDLSYLSNRGQRIGLFNDPEKEPYARPTHWVFLALFVGLITAEWIIRKAAGLV
jgi:hypothetical protein